MDVTIHQTIAQKEGHISHVRNMAHAIVRTANIDKNPLFSVFLKCPVDIFGEATENPRKCDIALLEYDAQTMLPKKVHLVIKCQVKDDDARNSLSELTNCLRDTDCKHGILMSPNIARIYRDNRGEGRPDQIGDELSLNCSDGVGHVVAFIKSLEFDMSKL